MFDKAVADTHEGAKQEHRACKVTLIARCFDANLKVF